MVPVKRTIRPVWESHAGGHVDLPKVTDSAFAQVRKSRIYRTPSVTMISAARDFIAFPQVKKSHTKSRTKSRTPLYVVEGCRP